MVNFFHCDFLDDCNIFHLNQQLEGLSFIISRVENVTNITPLHLQIGHSPNSFPPPSSLQISMTSTSWSVNPKGRHSFLKSCGRNETSKKSAKVSNLVLLLMVQKAG